MFEVMTFHLAEGVSDKQFLAANHRMQTEYAPHQHGLLRRTVGHTDSGDWVAIIHWQTVEDEEAAGKTWGEDEASREFAKLLNQDTAVTTYYKTHPGVLGTT